ncbi:hypothetical protein Leryth_024458 [Lithospermum erythrorhizon]|nr:hypothetical protein Leryth_024458 [Lithospermum erythrorhizon]
MFFIHKRYTYLSFNHLNENKARKPNKEVDEKSPLLPTHNEEHGGEFNGASFSGAVSNLSSTIVGAGIMALPAMSRKC